MSRKNLQEFPIYQQEWGIFRFRIFDNTEKKFPAVQQFAAVSNLDLLVNLLISFSFP